MRIHEIKTWPEPFDALQRGVKRFELRKHDRPFKVGDTLRLQEWIPGEERYTGREVEARVSYILVGGSFGLPEDMCILSLYAVMLFEGGGVR